MQWHCSEHCTLGHTNVGGEKREAPSPSLRAPQAVMKTAGGVGVGSEIQKSL